jgi:hypothetical protein
MASGRWGEQASCGRKVDGKWMVERRSRRKWRRRPIAILAPTVPGTASRALARGAGALISLITAQIKAQKETPAAARSKMDKVAGVAGPRCFSADSCCAAASRRPSRASSPAHPALEAPHRTTPHYTTLYCTIATARQTRSGDVSLEAF